MRLRSLGVRSSWRALLAAAEDFADQRVVHMLGQRGFHSLTVQIMAAGRWPWLPDSGQSGCRLLQRGLEAILSASSG